MQLEVYFFVCEEIYKYTYNSTILKKAYKVHMNEIMCSYIQVCEVHVYLHQKPIMFNKL